MAEHSYGLVVYRRVGAELEVLIGHMGGQHWANKDEHAWSIPKGAADPSEDPIAAARREFGEELGFAAPSGALIDLGSITQRGGKVVCAWAVEGDPALADFRPGQFSMQWPPRSGRLQTFPEVDRVKWVSLDQARTLLVAAQATFLDRLAIALAAG
ncbi:MAG TPA: NUDIX domain-containing protein [Aeromicrobium sp.]|nr:NUDIX domain-containing protein [Aeromicrobium sp.]